MSPKSDRQPVSLVTEGEFAKGEGERQMLCSEIGARTSGAKEEETGSADVPLVAVLVKTL